LATCRYVAAAAAADVRVLQLGALGVVVVLLGFNTRVWHIRDLQRK
jgi:cobalamin biosynthesis protein CobT